MPMGGVQSGIQAGTVAHFAAESAPAGWLGCNGASVSRSAYAGLFLAIGTTYGAGDGATTFNVPDLRGEFIRGLDSGRGVDVGRLIGSKQGGSNSPHVHGAGTLTAASNGAHVHTLSGMSLSAGDGFAATGNGGQGTTNSAGAHTHTISGSTDSEGGEARPRNVALLACIKF